MFRMLLLFETLSLLLTCFHTRALKFQERVDTTKGYCEDPRYGRVAFGEAGYDDVTCQQFLCGREWVIGFRCDLKPKEMLGSGCFYVNGTGHYPACCPDLRCEPLPP